jgi:putative transposase
MRCEVLAVCRRGVDDDLSRQAGAEIAAAASALFARVTAMAAGTRHRYGRRRMATHLQDEGFTVGRAQARRWMNQAGVAVPRPKRRGPVTTDRRQGSAVAPHLLARQVDVAKPDHVGVGDSSEVWTGAGWLSGSTLWDVSSRQVVGWAMSRRIATTVVQDAWRMALGRRHPSAGLMPPSERGSQDASHADQDILADHGIVCRLSGTGEGLDHAVAERCFGSVTREWTAHHDYATRREASHDMVAYIEMFYNSRRKHSYLGYVSPNEYEKFARVA